MLSSRPVNPDNGPYFPTKTPGRGLKNRAENAHGGIPMTVHGKGKNVAAPKTPFQPSSVQPQRLFKDQKLVLGTATRPLGDKTPLPNRTKATLFQTPRPQKSHLSKSIILEAAQQEKDGEDERPTQRPSSLRKHLKHPRMSNFQTPMNKGNHWDISDGDIVVPDAEPVQQEPIVEDEDDFDEVEYCPPKLDLPYQPPFDFDLPDYKEVGKSLRRIAFSVPCDDSPPTPESDIPPSEVRLESWNMINLPPLESDDPFHLARLELAKEAAKHAPKGAAAAAKPSIRSRPPPASTVSRVKNAADRTAPPIGSAKPPSALRVGTGVGSRPAPASAAKPKPGPASARVPPRSAVVSQSAKTQQPLSRVQPSNAKGPLISKSSSSLPRTKETSSRGTMPQGRLPRINEKEARRKEPLINKAQVEDLIGGDDFLFEV